MEAADLFRDQNSVFVDVNLVYFTPKCRISIRDQRNRPAGRSQSSFQANISWGKRAGKVRKDEYSTE